MIIARASDAGSGKPARRMFPPLFGRHCSDAGHGALAILVGRGALHADGADDLAIDHDRHAAVDWHDARHCQQAKVSAPLADALL